MHLEMYESKSDAIGNYGMPMLNLYRYLVPLLRSSMMMA